MASPVPGELSTVPLYVGEQWIPPELTLLESPIRDGTVLSLGSPDGCLTSEPVGLAEIRVVSGPDAGAIYRLPAGQADIGSGEAADVCIRDGMIAPLALRISVDDRGGCRVAAFEGVRAA